MSAKVLPFRHRNGAEAILSRLDGVKEIRRGDWWAKCPSHEDRTPSLHINETDDGTVLLHCFAGCPTSDVMQAVGLELADLFPNKLEPKPGNRKAKPRVSSSDLLRLLSYSATVLWIFTEDCVKGRPITPHDKAIVDRSYRDMQKILQEANYGPIAR